MLEGFRTYPTKIPVSQGAPTSPDSSDLRTRAWLRHLLDRLDDVRNWAVGKTPAPTAWQTSRKADAVLIRQTFQSGYAPNIPKRLTARSASLLDDIFGPVFAGRRGGGGKWFIDKLAGGHARPDEQRLQWIDDLVPGSLAAFYQLPAPFDPWFYDALDFQSPWFGRLYLFRAIDPGLNYPEWDEWLVATDDGSRLPDATRLPHKDRWSVSDEERARFESEMASAMVHSAFPLDVDWLEDSGNALEQLHAARAATRSGKAMHPITKVLRKLPDAHAFMALTNAIAAYRLAGLIHLEDRCLVAWWLRGALEAMHGRIRKFERRWFYPLPRKAAPFEGTLRNLGLTPRTTRKR